MNRTMKSPPAAGFTIIELMIATSVLSVILVLVTILMMSIGNLYYKGINQSRVQDDVRSISNDLSQHLQLSNQPPAISDPANSSNTFSGIVVSAYCIDTTRYSYVTGVQIGQVPPNGRAALRHVLWRDTVPPGAACLAANLTAATPTDKNNNGSDGVELIAPQSRLTQFCIGTIASSGQNANQCSNGTGSPYSVEVGVAYGDDDLLKNINPLLNSPNAACVGSTGDQFCATAYLDTTAVKRLTNDSL